MGRSLPLGHDFCWRPSSLLRGMSKNRLTEKGAKYLPQKCYKKEQFVSEKYATGVLTQTASLETKKYIKREKSLKVIRHITGTSKIHQNS